MKEKESNIDHGAALVRGGGGGGAALPWRLEEKEVCHVPPGAVSCPPPFDLQAPVLTSAVARRDGHDSTYAYVLPGMRPSQHGSHSVTPAFTPINRGPIPNPFPNATAAAAAAAATDPAGRPPVQQRPFSHGWGTPATPAIPMMEGALPRQHTHVRPLSPPALIQHTQRDLPQVRRLIEKAGVLPNSFFPQVPNRFTRTWPRRWGT